MQTDAAEDWPEHDAVLPPPEPTQDQVYVAGIELEEMTLLDVPELHSWVGPVLGMLVLPLSAPQAPFTTPPLQAAGAAGVMLPAE